jgi:hypothetical protein
VANDERVLELARAIRPYLAELYGRSDPGGADRTDRELARLLAAAVDADVEAEILASLRAPASIREWAAAFLQHGCPPGLIVTRTGVVGYRGLAGDPALVRAPRFECPHGDFVFYRISVATPVPQCPTPGHGPLREEST